MVKFGKDFTKTQNADLKEHYVNYKLLKVFIRNSLDRIIAPKDQNKEKEKEHDLSCVDAPTSPNFSFFNLKQNHSQLEEQNTDKSISKNFLDDIYNKFIDCLDKEVKKIYLFFVHRERDLYVQINSHLHFRQAYATFKRGAIANEFDELKRLSSLTFETSKFIYDNMTAIKKILKKFDKKFSHVLGKISYQYFEKKVESKSSDLLYILQFKIIDEVCVLLEDLMNDLKIKYEEKKIGTNKSFLSPSEEKLIPGSNYVECKQKEECIDLSTYIARKINELQQDLIMIDESYQKFKTSFKEWSSCLKGDLKLSSKIYSVTQGTSLGGETLNFSIESGCDKLNAKTGQVEKRKGSIDSEVLFSKENGSNVYITLFHSFFFMLSYSIVIPTNKNYLKGLQYDYYYSGFVMALTPFGALISLVYTRFWLSTSFKQPMVLSTFLICIGNFLYSMADYWDSITALCCGRFLLGLGANRVANRSYLLSFVPKRKLSRYLLYFQMCSLAGFAFGPLLSIPILYLQDFGYFSSSFNEYTNASWLVFFLAFCILIFIIFSYTDPYDSNFHIYSDRSASSELGSKIASLSFDNINNNDCSMIEQIDERLSQINEQSKYSDTNLVTKSIEKIVWREKKTVSYIYKSFVIFSIILFVVRVCSEALLIISPIYIHLLNESLDCKFTALLIGMSLILAIILGMIYGTYLSNLFLDRKLMICVIGLCIVFNFFILNIWYTSLWQYCIMFILLIISSNMLENISIRIFAKIIPSDYELLGVRAGYGIQICTTVGRLIGALLLTVAGFASNENLNRIAYGITLFLFVISLILSFIFYSDLRVKAIARILRGKAMRKLKRTEF